jgi:phage baseplate assembly protein W
MSNYSPKLPLLIDSSNGFENNQTILEVVHQNLKMILLTSPGERIMDPNFGVGLRRYLFEPNNEQTHYKIKAKIISQASEYLPYVKIEKVDFAHEVNDRNISSNGLLVTLQFYIDSMGIGSSLSVQV